MAISSNSVFHYTKSLSKLTFILKEWCFRPSYCHEVNGILGIQNVRIPMVSFCDIPLSQTNNILSYGSYTIGLKKEWAFNNSINPVFYFNKKSLVYQRYSDLMLTSEQLNNNGKANNFSPHLQFLLPEPLQNRAAILGEQYKETLYEGTLNYYQNYKQISGKLVRKGKVISENYKFYDERELRFIPNIPKNEYDAFPPIIFENEWNTNWQSKFPKKPHFTKYSKYRLQFTSEDINHIILKNENEIPLLINKLKQSKHLSTVEIDILITKITTFSKIKSDF